MKIKITLDKDSIDTAIAQVKAYKKSLNAKVERIVEELANMGARIVESQYAIPMDDSDYDVSCIVNGNNAMIIAEGDGVIFLEFGTGVDVTDKTQEFGMETEGLPPIYPGSWSETEGSGVFAKHGHWHYKGVDYTGTMATMGFYFASKEIREKAVNVAKKVFRE